MRCDFCGGTQEPKPSNNKINHIRKKGRRGFWPAQWADVLIQLFPELASVACGPHHTFHSPNKVGTAPISMRLQPCQLAFILAETRKRSGTEGQI